MSSPCLSETILTETEQFVPKPDEEAAQKKKISQNKLKKQKLMAWEQIQDQINATKSKKIKQNETKKQYFDPQWVESKDVNEARGYEGPNDNFVSYVPLLRILSHLILSYLLSWGLLSSWCEWQNPGHLKSDRSRIRRQFLSNITVIRYKPQSPH